MKKFLNCCFWKVSPHDFGASGLKEVQNTVFYLNFLKAHYVILQFYYPLKWFYVVENFSVPFAIYVEKWNEEESFYFYCFKLRMTIVAMEMKIYT